MLSDGLSVPCTNSSIQHSSTFMEPDMYKCNQIPFFCDSQNLPKYIWQTVIDPLTGKAAPGSAQEKSQYIIDPVWAATAALGTTPATQNYQVIYDGGHGGCILFILCCLFYMYCIFYFII